MSTSCSVSLSLSDDSKQDDYTTTSHSKHLIELLKGRKVLTSLLITIWEYTDGCAEKYRCTSELYLMSVMSQCYSVITDSVISEPGHGREVVDGLNTIKKQYIYIDKCLMFN